tara:strand:+ start:380 stop:523 length:144 start_codon:yes stop_codon:yes gene_type:complete
VNKKIFFFWLLMVIIWNYGFPEAEPFYDVFVAVILSLISVRLQKIKL